jgi:hypothetical protein
MKDAIRRAINGLMSRGTFKLDLVPETKGGNVFPSKFMLFLKSKDGHDVYVARSCLSGHLDVLKHTMVCTATICHKHRPA